MKTKTTFIFLFLCSTVLTYAQPQTGTWEIGGSGYRTKIYNNNELNYKITQINTEISYFPFKHLSFGGIFTYQKQKDFTKAFDPVFHNLFIAPTLEAYIINRKVFGVSVKGAINFSILSNFPPGDKTVSSYRFGPKTSWNITPNFCTFLWFAYRKLDWFDNTIGFRSTVPSDNFDIRWGFSYFLHRKEKE
ncbi:MAG: hypothetical protein R2757_02885 [Draconibacterium sp.]